MVSGLEVEVAVAAPLLQSYTYKADCLPAAGSRVVVPLGPRRVLGVVLGPSSCQTENKFEVKKIAEILDDVPYFSPELMRLARWLSEYYQHPLGEVFRTMMPASSVRTKTIRIVWTGDSVIQEIKERQEWATAKSLFGSKEFLLRSSFLKRIVSHGLLERWRLNPAEALKELAKLGLVKESKVSLQRGRRTKLSQSRPEGDELKVQSPELTADQQRVLDQIRTQNLLDVDAVDRRPNVLLGVTGSGKTELYLQLIAMMRIKRGNGQALMMVPEIALTPQMTRVFLERFPGQVAVVHSAMSDKDRWHEISRIRSGEASILIGPRSAVFAPFEKLSLILVDEEHDSSYKQTTGLCYHGRDVAILRASIEGSTVFLGSATPSLETYQNARSKRYQLFEIAQRVHGRKLPEVQMIEHQPAFRFGSKPLITDADQDVESMISPQIIDALQKNCNDGFQSIVLVNRRGYAHYLFSLTRSEAVKCPNCSISLTLHARSRKLHCHYCDYVTYTHKILADNPTETYLAVGFGSERMEGFIKSRLQNARVSRLDSDVAGQRMVLQEVLEDFRLGKIDVLVGTQILAKGHDFPRVTLIALIEVDQLLNLPDFRAGERTFQLLVQASGRAGRGDFPGQVLLQTMKPGERLIGWALHHDYKSFAEKELELRRDHDLPPFRRIIAIEINGSDRKSVIDLSDKMALWIEHSAQNHPEEFRKIKVLGPSAPPIEMIRGRRRRIFLFSSAEYLAIGKLTRALCTAFRVMPGDIRLQIDVDPQSML